MPDLSADFTIPNAFGLMAVDAGYDMDAYRAMLGFLSDLASGTEEATALEANGGTPAMLRAWEGNSKFRRVLGKCRAAGRAERAHAAAREAAEEPEADTESGQRFVPLEDAPAQRSVFALQPNRDSWGG